MSTTFDVTTAEVLALLPMDTSGVSATSSPLRLSDVTGYIKSGGALYAGALGSAGISTELTGDAREQIAEGVCAWAAAQCLMRMGYSKAGEYGELKARHERLLERYTSRPDLVATGRTTTLSNVPVGERKARTSSARKFGSRYDW